MAPLHALQSPFNLFERQIENDVLPYCRNNDIATLGYGALCRGLLTGRMRTDTVFRRRDLRRTDPKFVRNRASLTISCPQSDQLDRLAGGSFRQARHSLWPFAGCSGPGDHSAALWGARHTKTVGAGGRRFGLGTSMMPTMAEIDRILREHHH